METLHEIINYRKADNLTVQDVELLGKLDQSIFPLDPICAAIKQGKLSLLRVSYDDKIYGILVVRGVITSNGDLCMVIDHAIAEDNIKIHFENILKESLWSFVANQKFNGKYFTKIHQHAHNKGLKRILERHYGEAKEFIFIKDIREFKND